MTTTEKLYPNVPSAPPEDSPQYINLMRRDRVSQIYKELTRLKDERNKTYKKYSKAASVLSKGGIVLASLATVESAAGIATTLTVIGAPIGLVLTGLGTLSGLTAAVLSPITKHCERKKMKHAKSFYILDTGLIVLNKRISSILNHNILTNEEYHSILEHYEQIKQKLYQFDTSQLKESVKKEILSKVQI